jgi:hypothetical protein
VETKKKVGSRWEIPANYDKHPRKAFQLGLPYNKTTEGVGRYHLIVVIIIILHLHMSQMTNKAPKRKPPIESFHVL